MNFVVDNWYIIAVMLTLLTALVLLIYRFMVLPTEKQLAKVREWLLWAVTQAEKELGGGTGQLKLRSVYDLFVQRFSWLAKVISFDDFSDMVDDALVQMRVMLAKNATIAALVEGESDEETAKIGFEAGVSNGTGE